MAGLFFADNNIVEGQKALEQAVAGAPDDPEAYMLLAAIAMSQNDFAKAEALYRKAHRLLSTFDKSAKRKEQLQPRIYSGLAATSEARHDWAAAQGTLETWLKLEPKNGPAMQRLAHCLYEQKNVSGALEELRQASKADSQIPCPELVMAKFYRHSGDNKNADKWMAAAISAAPTDFKTHLACGLAALDAGQIEEASKQAKAAVQIAPQSVSANYLRGVVAMLEKEYEVAELYFGKALKLSPHNFTFSNNLALALAQQNDEAKERRALEYAEANTRQYPSSVDAAATYAWTLYRLGRVDDAEKALRGAASVANSDIDAAYITACVAVKRDRKAEARRMLESALKNPKPFLFRQDAQELLEQLKN